MKIVIADDSDILRKRIKESLNEIDDIEIVGEAKNGIEAVKVIREKNPDFVLLDIRMPKMNGLEVLKKIKAETGNAKICVFTNYPYSEYKTKCLLEGADYFFDKNTNFREIKDIVAQLHIELNGVHDG